MTDPTLSDILANSEKLFKKVQELTAENKIMRDEILKISNSPEITSDGIKADLRELLWRLAKVKK